MNTSDRHILSYIHSGLLSLALCLASVATSAHAGQPGPWGKIEKWQNNRLFQPTARQKAQEVKGKVVIYDGLTDATVDKAMDRNFDRIQNMMFIRVIRTGKTGKPIHKEDGSVEVEDDDC
jgi:hypothetical protein